MSEQGSRHCWECQRRHLVCDFKQPACSRCIAAGVACPGYDATKPVRLRWLAPGRVKSRQRRLHGAQPNSLESKNAEAGLPKQPAHTNSSSTVPRFNPTTEICALFQGAEYYNSCIHADLIPIQGLGTNLNIYPLSPSHIQNSIRFPDYIRFSMVCVTLSHRMNRTRDDPQSKALAETFYRYRGLAIRSLREDIDAEDKCTSDVLIAGIITLLLVDAQQGVSPNWRWHLEGVRNIVSMRGGMRALFGSRGLGPLLRCLVLVAVVGNTTTPASDLTMAISHPSELDFILKQYEGSLFAFQTCPPPLFAEIVKVNHLRARASGITKAGAKELSQPAYEILGRIYGFSPELWAEARPLSKEGWVLLASAYQEATALYCISSLQSLYVLPRSSQLQASRSAHGQALLASLTAALPSPALKYFLLWPLFVLGMEGINGSTAIRNFVRQQLPELSRYVGTSVPLVAKEVLEKFWASGETSWDACFDRPYAFLMQIAVDIDEVLSVHGTTSSTLNQ